MHIILDCGYEGKMLTNSQMENVINSLKFIKKQLESIDCLHDYHYGVQIDYYYPERLKFKLDYLSVECTNFCVWSWCKAYGGFEIEFNLDTKKFSIGGGEVDEFESDTLKGLFKKIKQCVIKM